MKNDNKEIKENALLITERLKSLTEIELEFLLKGLNHPAEKGNDYANKLEIGNFIYYTKFLENSDIENVINVLKTIIELREFDLDKEEIEVVNRNVEILKNNF